TTVVERAREIFAQTQEEVRKLEGDRERGGLGPNIIRGGPEHNAAKALLRRAMTLSGPGRDFAGAYELIDEAQAVDPDFWEVFRVRAFLKGLQGKPGVVEEYETALLLAPPDGVASVKLFFAGHLCRVSGQQERAVALAREAAEEVRSDSAQFTLGTALRFAQELDEAIVVLGELRDDPAIEHAMKIKVSTALLNTYRRKTDRIISTTRDPDEGLAVFAEALSVIESTLQDKWSDDRLVKEIVNLVSEVLRFSLIVDDPSRVAGLLVTAAAVYKAVRFLPGSGLESGYVATHAQSLLGQAPELESIVQPLLEGAETAVRTDLPGYVLSFDREKLTGWIGSPLLDRRIFFHVHDLVDGAQRDLLEPLAMVQFKIQRIGRGTGAGGIIVEASAGEYDLWDERPLTVVEVMDTFGFVRDDETGIEAFLHMDKREANIVWTEVEIGTQWTGNLCPAHKGIAVSQLRRRDGPK
ncbi:MAG: hypothetical protein QGI09_04275, partial [Dehalococcoidia bacterium]|nr:hypothetical protein [Dehalococcoidia bacterium]